MSGEHSKNRKAKARGRTHLCQTQTHEPLAWSVGDNLTLSLVGVLRVTIGMKISIQSVHRTSRASYYLQYHRQVSRAVLGRRHER